MCTAWEGCSIIANTRHIIHWLCSHSELQQTFQTVILYISFVLKMATDDEMQCVWNRKVYKLALETECKWPPSSPSEFAHLCCKPWTHSHSKALNVQVIQLSFDSSPQKAIHINASSYVQFSKWFTTEETVWQDSDYQSSNTYISR